MPQITCNLSGVSIEAKEGKAGVKLPRGWKRLPDGRVASPDALREQYRHVAVRLTVVGIAEGENRLTNEAAKEAWRAFRSDLRESQSGVAEAVNRVLSALYAGEPSPILPPKDKKTGKVKLPPVPAVNAYQTIRAARPDLNSRVAVALSQRAQKLYVGDRWDILRGAKSLRTQRPERQPVPIHNEAVKLRWLNATDRVPVVSLPLTTSGRRWELVLSPGRGRKAAARRWIADLIEGRAWCGEATVGVRAVGTNRSHGGGAPIRAGQKRPTEVVVTIAGWVPRGEERKGGGTDNILYLRTAPDALLVAIDEDGDRIWRLCYDHLRKWFAEHDRRRERWADDRKAEQRPVPRFELSRTASLDRHHRRTKKAIEQAAAETIAYARRRRAARIVYDDSDRQFAPHLPYYRLKEQLSAAADRYGIAFEVASADASGDVTSEDRDSLEPAV